LKGENSSSFLVYDGAKPRLGLDNDVWDTHLPAKRGDKHDELNRVDVMSNNDKVRLLRLDEGNAVVKTVLDEKRFLVLTCNLSDMSSGQLAKCYLFLIFLGFSNSLGFSI
jgi:hypothetical protein